ncbi:DUF2169 domain-containing protein [Massilia sp. W12]|uniref:DUF2169 domain-containing protein n=1 Tax=Massilia sp. W12 TaxID=3126507 RepID=UPI0030D4EE4C
MRFELDNQTPFAAHVQSEPDLQGHDAALVLLKASFILGQEGFAPVEQQTPLRQQALRKRIGELGLEEVQMRLLSSWLEEEVVWQTHETSPPKAQFEILLCGHVSHAQPQAALDAILDLGGQQRHLRAHAPRYHDGAQIRLVGGGVRSVPLCASFAHWDGGIFTQSQRLPSVAGLPAPEWLPWFDDPAQSVTRRAQQAAPRCFAAWPENAPSRLPYAGTFDERWQQQRAPLMPQDFNPRFYNCADPALQWAQAPAPGTLLTLHNFGAQGRSALRWPALRFAARVQGVDGRTQQAEMRADTLEIDLLSGRYHIVWRAQIAAAQRQDGRGVAHIWRLSKEAA